ncbi:globin domain-containing protein [Psychrosphaera algicola]|uniref:globin domain-containing protein n=1 Tax=Psychrosphaera algicola TaxID=3023714 RepID=UPI002FEE01A5
MSNNISEYGVNDNSYKSAGELAGITQLVDEFYHNMANLKEAKKIRDMHPKDLTLSKQKLTYFLSGWLGGPKLYSEHFGSINIPNAHKHLHVSKAESEALVIVYGKSC